MSQFNKPAFIPAGATIDITATELAAANGGQRPDLLWREDVIYRESATGVLYVRENGQLLPLDIPLSASRNVTGADDGKRFACTTAVTLTIPAGLVPRPEFMVLPPSSGNLSIAFTGTTGNGAGTTLTRARTTNAAGIVVRPYPEANAYGVSGS